MTSAPPSPGIDGGSISPAARLSRPDQAKPLTPQGIQPPGRHNAKVGTIGVVPTSEQRRIGAPSRDRRFVDMRAAEPDGALVWSETLASYVAPAHSATTSGRSLCANRSRLPAVISFASR